MEYTYPIMTKSFFGWVWQATFLQNNMFESESPPLPPALPQPRQPDLHGLQIIEDK